MKRKIKKYLNILIDVKRQNNELIWSNVWHDTIKGIEWCNNLESVSPGRWAVGYNYLYITTRVLNDIKPQSVLEFGLGISSSLFSAYFEDKNEKYIHDIIEQDSSWIDFYSKNRKLSARSNLHHHQVQTKEYDWGHREEYSDLDKTIMNKRYSVISIDGPKGAEHFSRGDILKYLPSILEDSFAIIVDDSQREGENETIEEMKKILEKNNIKYEIGCYSGITDCTIIVSSNLKFLCSL